MQKRAKWSAFKETGKRPRLVARRIRPGDILELADSEQLALRYRAPRRLRRISRVSLNQLERSLDRRGFLRSLELECGQHEISTSVVTRSYQATAPSLQFQLEITAADGQSTCSELTPAPSASLPVPAPTASNQPESPNPSNDPVASPSSEQSPEPSSSLAPPASPSPSTSPSPSPSSSNPPAPSPSPTAEPSPDFELFINAGSAASFTDGEGRTWQSDLSYIASGYNLAFNNGLIVSGAINQQLFNSERVGNFQYEIPLNEGTYRLRLHMAELYWTSAGERVFNVEAEGQTVAASLDLFASSGALTAYVLEADVSLSDGSLSLALSPSANWGTVSALEIVQLSGESSATPTPSSSATATPSASASPSPSASPSATPSPTPSFSPTPTPSPGEGNLSAFWANTGEDKVVQDELRATNEGGAAVLNSAWDGNSVQLFAAKNEVVAFNTVLEAGTGNVTVNSLTLNKLTGPGGFELRSRAESGDGVFNYVGREIELFYVRYLQIRGLSGLSYDAYDERHVPKKLQRPFIGEGLGQGTWYDRPNADKHYPDIAVPLELALPFTIESGKNQSIWADIFIPKSAPAGIYTGSVNAQLLNGSSVSIPVELEVLNFELPDEPNSKTMLYLGYSDTNRRYIGQNYPSGAQVQAEIDNIRNNHFMLAHRHKISIIDGNYGATVWNSDAPRPEWQPRLDGSLYTAANGYDGPGIGTGNNIFSVGTYGTWSWRGEGQAAMWQRTDNWANWFQTNSPSTEYFLYLIDESSDYAQTNQWAQWVNNNPGIGSTMPTFATAQIPNAAANTPELDIAAGWMATGPTDEWQNGADYFNGTPGKCTYMYNGKRPATGSFATEDDGIALRQLAWAQHKKNICRWFFWESTYYNNFQGGTGQTNVFQSAFTFGGNSNFDNVRGQTGWNYSNGDGVLFYPGTDTVYPSESYGLSGPIASLRLKFWRRGIQDVDYISLASAIDPAAVQQIVQDTVPEVLWEPGISDPSDPTWVRADISWSTNPDNWEAVRRQLADIITGAE